MNTATNKATKYVVQCGNGGQYLAKQALSSIRTLGLLTPVTSSIEDALIFEDLDSAHEFQQACNRSPRANWHVHEVTV